MAVFVLDRRGRPLMPCSEKRARRLLARGRARVHRCVPFAIRLLDRRVEDSVLQPLRLKLDPGSKVTGMALVREVEAVAAARGERMREAYVLALMELAHRGHAIRKALGQRRNYRRFRRYRKTRYRAPRFANRRRPVGWLAPSLQHRLDTTLAWVARLRRWTPVTALGVETVRFDTQRLDKPDIHGLEYQHGTLAGYEIREYLLERWGRRCAYCDAEGVLLQLDHIQPKARGGSDRVSNLTLACGRCNQAKGAREVREFLDRDPPRRERLLAQARAPLSDAAAVNATRRALHRALEATGLPVEAASGGRTQWNRTRFGLPKTHALDAACVGELEALHGWQRPVLAIRCSGRGAYQRTRLDRFGLPRGYLTRRKRHFGVQTGDRVRAEVPAGKHAGVHVGRVAVRASGYFNLQTAQGVVQGISHRHCRLVQRADGYGYSIVAPTEQGERDRGDAGRRALSLPGLKAEVSRAN